MNFFFSEEDRFMNGNKIEKFKNVYDTHHFNSLKDLAISLKPLSNNDIPYIKKEKTNIVNVVPPNIIVKSKLFTLTKDEFEEFIFDEELFDEMSLDIELMDDGEVKKIDEIQKELDKGPQQFILSVVRSEHHNNSMFYNRTCSIFLCKNNIETNLYKKNYYNIEKFWSKSCILDI